VQGNGDQGKGHQQTGESLYFRRYRVTDVNFVKLHLRWIMVVSSDSLFHFTCKKEHLIDILKNSFHANYCFENFNDVIRINRSNIKLAIPMLCFCDLPLSNITDHIAFYGSYGLGLIKEWGKRNGLNPVSYLYKNSNLTNALSEYFTENIGSILEKMKEVENNGNTKSYNEVMNFLTLYCFLKEYDGNMKDLEFNTRYKKFIDEKEWRYVPKNQNLFIEVDGQVKNKNNYETAKTRLKENKLLFSPDDITYIIVKKEIERLEMITIVEGNKEYCTDIIKILCSKIISVERLKQDF
jgi:hypothetical protein